MNKKVPENFYDLMKAKGRMQHEITQGLLEVYENIPGIVNQWAVERQHLYWSMRTKQSNSWLTALSPEADLLLNEDFSMAVKYRLHVPLSIIKKHGRENCDNKGCRGSQMDEFGDHSLQCIKAGLPRLQRHNEVCEVISKYLRDKGLTVDREVRLKNRMEVDSKYQNSDYVMDIVASSPSTNQVYWLDVSIRSTTQKKTTKAKIVRVGEAAKKGEADKRERYGKFFDYKHPDHSFVPFVIETGGRWGEAAQKFIQVIETKYKQNHSDTKTNLKMSKVVMTRKISSIVNKYIRSFVMASLKEVNISPNNTKETDKAVELTHKDEEEGEEDESQKQNLGEYIKNWFEEIVSDIEEENEEDNFKRIKRKREW
eukprot:GDKJ01055209.1.p1 GENE.GDKJ01055209.1~~GDKJ01055209.1.p1  ORF type:complete len:425 (+),score=46.97 GDKJ01055209.1:171-1277(+)